MRRAKVVLGVLCLLLLAFSAAIATQEGAAKKPAAKKPAAKKGMLLPDWKAENGTYQAPAAKVGEKPDQPWTQTTVSAAVGGKPLEGEVVTVTGEIIDYSCYLQVGKHGEKHKDCGVKCLRNGQPIGLLAEDGTIYLLMEEEHDPRRDSMTDFRGAAIENFADVVEVTGTRSAVDGQRAIYVHGYLKK